VCPSSSTGPSHLAAPDPLDAFHAMARTQRFWEHWSARCSYWGEWTEPVQTSLLALKGLTYAPTGGIVAAPTASLPEAIGGVRNTGTTASAGSATPC
jgi:GH15 family glucan-1,4-alpha-glucosidase